MLIFTNIPPDSGRPTVSFRKNFMTQDKNSLSYRLQLPGYDDQKRVTSPAATDRLSAFNARRLRLFGVVADECVEYAEGRPGDPQARSSLALSEIRAFCGSGTSYC